MSLNSPARYDSRDTLTVRHFLATRGHRVVLNRLYVSDKSQQPILVNTITEIPSNPIVAIGQKEYPKI